MANTIKEKPQQQKQRGLIAKQSKLLRSNWINFDQFIAMQKSIRNDAENSKKGGSSDFTRIIPANQIN